MRNISLREQDIHTGNLILVNREFAYTDDKTTALVPVQEQIPSVLLRRRAVVLLSDLMRKIKGWEKIVPVSGWRSLREQQEIWNDSLAENGREFTEKYVAVPGHSEHQTGLAIDLGLKQEKIDFIRPDFPYHGLCQTFREEAAGYGFVERYPAGKEAITGIGHEPWHFRYVGVPHAEIMTKTGMVLEEYLTYLKQFSYEKNCLLYQSGKKEFEVSYLPALPASNTTLMIEADTPYLLSGNNMDGYIVTRWKDKKEHEPERASH